jgi:hypothetical protein
MSKFISNAMEIKYEFATLLFAQKIQKNVSSLRGLTQGILTPKGWYCYRKLKTWEKSKRIIKRTALTTLKGSNTNSRM